MPITWCPEGDFRPGFKQSCVCVCVLSAPWHAVIMPMKELFSKLSHQFIKNPNRRFWKQVNSAQLFWHKNGETKGDMKESVNPTGVKMVTGKGQVWRKEKFLKWGNQLGAHDVSVSEWELRWLKQPVLALMRLMLAKENVSLCCKSMEKRVWQNYFLSLLCM